jgi:hypothetical protein
VGVAISTTGQEHRLPFLETCVAAWDRALDGFPGASLFVTVDGTEDEATRVARAVADFTGSVYRIEREYGVETQRRGVAVSKNTGLELLIDNTNVEHLFLCDDDAWPLYSASLDKHIRMAEEDILHSMVNWGASRFRGIRKDPDGRFAWSEWTWPRGVVQYVHRSVVGVVGGMDERFGQGGHEHVEWSERICEFGFTPAPFCSPVSYAERGVEGNMMRASALWHCEDMRKPGETVEAHQRRKAALTTISRSDRDWSHINKIMSERRSNWEFVPFRASENGRASATLTLNNPSADAEESQ